MIHVLGRGSKFAWEANSAFVDPRKVDARALFRFMWAAGGLYFFLHRTYQGDSRIKILLPHPVYETTVGKGPRVNLLERRGPQTRP